MARQADHNRAEDLLSAYLDQQVTAVEKQFFELHVAACADCRAQLEATRSLVAALKAMPAVKAPRSFVLPREMAKQPKRSIFAWYPALRLATALAAIAFVVLFAGDMLLSRPGSGGGIAMSVPMAAPAPQMEQAAESTQAPAATVVALAAPTEAPAPEVSNTVAATAPGAAAPAGAAAKSVSTETVTLTDTAATMLVAPTATVEMPAVAAVPPTLETTPEPAADASSERAMAPAVEQPATTAVTPAAPPIDPLRAIEIALLALVVVLGIATLVVRRKQV
jgi:predicted anti-sigma-YlaC factor YlaD